jgi:hypothetical protein
MTILWLAIFALVIWSTFFNRRWVVHVDLLMVMIGLIYLARSSFRGGPIFWDLFGVLLWIYFLDKDLKEEHTDAPH